MATHTLSHTYTQQTQHTHSLSLSLRRLQVALDIVHPDYAETDLSANIVSGLDAGHGYIQGILPDAAHGYIQGSLSDAGHGYIQGSVSDAGHGYI